jgi:hypothetical protein
LSLRQSFQLLCDSQSHPGGRLSLPRRYHLAKKTGRRRNVTEARGPTVHEKRFERAGSIRSGSSDSCWERQDCAITGHPRTAWRTGEFGPRPCQNSAKFCDRSREARIFAISLSQDGLRARKSERNRSVWKRAGVFTQPGPIAVIRRHRGDGRLRVRSEILCDAAGDIGKRSVRSGADPTAPPAQITRSSSMRRLRRSAS